MIYPLVAAPLCLRGSKKKTRVSESCELAYDFEVKDGGRLDGGGKCYADAALNRCGKEPAGVGDGQ